MINKLFSFLFASKEENIKEPRIEMVPFPLIRKVLAEFDSGGCPENKVRTIKTWQPELFKSLGYVNQNGWFINDIITVCLMIFKRHGWIMSYSDIAEILLEYEDMSGKEQQTECNKVREWQPLLWASSQNLIKKEVGPAALISIILEIFRQWESCSSA